MKLGFTCSAIILSLVLLSSATAQNFFWSFDGFGEGALNDDLVVNADENPTGTVNLYYHSNNQNITEGFILDFLWDVNGVVGFTAAETFDAEVGLVTDSGDFVALSNRYGDGFGPAGSVTSDRVEFFVGINVVNGTGISEVNIPGVIDGNGLDFIDTLYDTSAEAFFIGTIDYEFLGAGVANIQFDGVAVDGGSDLLSTGAVSTNGLTFVSGVPEPAAASLLSLGLTVILTSRRRS